MRNIGRSFSVSKCEGQRYNYETQEIEDFYVELYGNFTPQRATNKLRKEYKDKTIQIFYVEQDKHYYTMTFDDFIKYGRKVY